ncbi:MAG: BatA domain-containing protein, partial [Methermicoccaceae archaeon]
MPLENAGALLAAAGIIPLVVLYLLKPRTIRLRISSVILLLKTKEKNRLASLFQRLVKDPLLLLQILFVLLITLAAAGPFLPTSQAVAQGHVALVIDA